MTTLTTWSGRKIDYINPLPEQICIQDIATALSRECRYAGHASHFYSVAQHSVLCSRVVPLDADNILLVTEIRDLFLPGRILHKTPVAAEPMKGRIWPLAPETAKDQFLERFNFLMR